jgi:ABC-2 type transport system ATP-binding protein
VDAFREIPGVRHVAVADHHGSLAGYEIEAEANRDLRRDVARSVVERGWGLLELRPTRMSLEDIFLQLTTEEQPEEAQHG